MVIIKSLKMRIYPNKTQQYQLDNTLNCCRFIYNYMLSRNIKVYERRGEHLSYKDMQNLLPIMKKYLPWLREVDSQALKYACRQLDSAYRNFFKKHVGYPKYKRKRGKQSYTNTRGENIHIDKASNKIQLPTIGKIKCRGIRNIANNYTIKSATVSKEFNGHYYVSICYQIDISTQENDFSNPIAIGLDYKVTGLYVDSNGNYLNKEDYFAKSAARLKKEQQKLFYKKGFKKGEKKSKRYFKQLTKICNIYRHITNQRKDFLHKQSTAIAKQYNVVCIEDLSIKNIYVQYDKNINTYKAKHNINRVITDDGWCMFTRMLAYKLAWQNKKLVMVNKYYPSSKTCSNCGHIQNMPLDKRIYNCSCCGMTMDRDYNAAINIKNEGLRILKENM